MHNPNILPTGPTPIPVGPELMPASPAAVIAEHAPLARNAAGLGIMNVLGGLSPLLPIAGIGFLTWLGADMILGGALGNPFTPKSARHMG